MPLKIDVDISFAEDIAKEAERELKRTPKIMLAAVKAGAFYAVQEKGYTNRTWRLTKSTQGKPDLSGLEDVRVVLEADTEYAQYVRGRGLMAIDEAARKTEQTIQDQLENVAEKLSRG